MSPDDGTAARELFGPGVELGGYRIERLAFEGGFASIFEATHTDGRKAAIKVLRGALAQSEKMLARFEREAAAIRTLEHPSIVELYDVGEVADGRPYIAMQWLPGRNLLEELEARGPLTQREALRVVEDLGDALEAAHAVGIIHRDLKAQNIMAVPEGDWFRVVLVDFGIAKIRHAEGVSTLTTQTLLGTPQTAAPEQIMGEEIDARTDVYALGLLLFQLLTGRLPFEAPTAVELEEMHLHVPPPRASELAPVSPAIDRVIQRAMAKHPNDRFGSAGVFVNALRKASRATTDAETTMDMRRGVGLWISARSEDDDDRSLEAVDSILSIAERELAGADLRIALDSPSAILAVAEINGERQARARAVAEAVLAALPQLDGADAVELRVALHTGLIETCGGELLGGELLKPGSWPASAFLGPTAK